MRAFLLNAILITAILGTSLTSYASLPKEHIESLRDQLPVELNNEVSWKNCGGWNGFYYYGSGDIELCNENLEEAPGVARFLYLHELGHAFTVPRKIDSTRFGGNMEDMADEFAMILSIVQKRPEDLLAMASAWETYDKRNPYQEGDTHSPHLVRASRLRYMYWGYRMQFGPGFDYYRAALRFWKLRFLEAQLRGHT